MDLEWLWATLAAATLAIIGWGARLVWALERRVHTLEMKHEAQATLVELALEAMPKYPRRPSAGDDHAP